MYIDKILKNFVTTTLVKIKYDCCGKEHTLKYKDAKKNYEKNSKKHICRTCWLKTANPASNPEVREKMKKTSLERYGTICALNTEENTAARVEKMFGTEKATKKIVAKRRATSRKRYGTDHPMQNEDVKAKQQAVLEEKYGTHVPLQNEEIKAKMQQTVQERYGVTNVALIPEVQQKMSQTMMERYGVERYNELPEMKDWLRERCREWLKGSWANPWSKGIVRPEEWNEKQSETVCGLIESGQWRHGGKRTYQGTYRSTKCLKKTPIFRSGYELHVHVHLDENNDVEFYDYEPFQVPYYDAQGKKRHYTVDFIIGWRNGSLTTIEIKNSHTGPEFLKHPKHKALKELCDLNGMGCEVWTNNDIKRLGLDFTALLTDPRVKVTRTPK